MKSTDNQTKRFYWLKLKDNFFDREEIQLIESLPNGKEYVLILLKFMMKAINSEGRLVVKDVIPYNPQMLATVTHSNVDTVRSAIDIFIKFGLMSTLDDGTLYMNEVQALLGSETEFAAKKREYRQNLKNQPKQLPDKPETQKDFVQDNVRQENRDKSLDNRNNTSYIPQSNNSNEDLGIVRIWLKKIQDRQFSFTLDEEHAISEFAKYKANSESMTDQQIIFTLEILSDYKNSGYDIIRMIKNSIAKNYKGIMEPTKNFLITNGTNLNQIMPSRYPAPEYTTPENKEQKIQLRNYLERCYLMERIDPRTGKQLTPAQRSLLKTHFDSTKKKSISITDYIYQNEVLTGKCLLEQSINGQAASLIDVAA